MDEEIIALIRLEVRKAFETVLKDLARDPNDIRVGGPAKDPLSRFGQSEAAGKCCNGCD